MSTANFDLTRIWTWVSSLYIMNRDGAPAWPGPGALVQALALAREIVLEGSCRTDDE